MHSTDTTTTVTTIITTTMTITTETKVIKVKQLRKVYWNVRANQNNMCLQAVKKA